MGWATGCFPNTLVGMLHTTLEEVGEDEKLGGELTGRLLQVPNLIILDQSVLNYSKDYSVQYETISSDYMFDEVRIPLTTDSNLEKAMGILEEILKKQDAFYIDETMRFKGLGKIMMAFMSKLAITRGCKRLEWGCLDWNQKAVKFYKELGAASVDPMTIYRFSPDVLKENANRFNESIGHE